MKVLDIQFTKGIPKSLTFEYEGKEYRFITGDKLKSANTLLERHAEGLCNAKSTIDKFQDQLKSARRIFKWFRDAESNIYLPDNAIDSIDQWLKDNVENPEK